MRVPLGGEGGSAQLLDREASNDPFVRIRDVLEVHHNHPPIGQVAFRDEPEGADDCLCASQRAIRRFAFGETPKWVSYGEIRQAFARMKAAGSRARICPYAEREVFAPIKVVLADTIRPIRAVLTFEPVYPWQAKLAIPKPGYSLWFTYAAVALLNSRYALPLYMEAKRRFPSRSAKPHGLSKRALLDMRLAKRMPRPEVLEEVAALTHRVISLRDALLELRQVIQAEGPGVQTQAASLCQAILDDEIRTTTGKLEDAIPRLLELTEQQERELLVSAQGPGGAPSGIGLLPPSETIGSLGRPEPVGLANQLEDKLQAAGLTDQKDAKWYERAMKLLRYWDDVASHLPPESLDVGATPIGRAA